MPESKAGAAREIALAFGVPPLLLGLPGDNTFSNYTEANRAFWRQTVLPLVAPVQKSFQAWLQPGFGAFRLDYNADRLEALASERASEWERVAPARFDRKKPSFMSAILDVILERGDLAHLALFLWACAATAQAYFALRELSEATRRLDAFVRELARFNRRCRSD